MDSQSKSRSKSTAAITCIKLLLHVFNFLYMIIGICVLAIGIWTQVELKNYMELTDLYYANAAYIMIGVGVLILLVALGGFFCTAKDKIAPLYMYGIFISLLAIIQVAAGIAGGAFAHTLDQKFVTGLEKTIKDSAYRDAWDKVQQKLHCCGVNKSTDWAVVPNSCYKDNKPSAVSATTTTKAPTKAPPIPKETTTETTTKPQNASITTETTTPSNSTSDNGSSVAGNITSTKEVPTTTTVSPGRKRRETPKIGGDGLYLEGCHSKITAAVNSYLGVIVGVCIGFVVLQVIGAVLACCLAKKTSKNNYEQIY